MRQYERWFPPKVLLTLGFESTGNVRPLIWVLPLLLLIACKTSAQGDGEYTDTVYPEVWDWQAEQYKLDRTSSTNFYYLENGDVLVNFVWIDQVDGENEFHHEYFTFFGGQTFISLEEAFVTLEGDYHDGIASERLDSIFDVKRLSNGNEIDADTGTLLCGRSFDSGISIYDRSNSEYVIDKTIFFFLPEKPFIYPETLRCEDYDVQFAHDVAIFSPGRVIPLRDNTFLVVNTSLGTIVRFDENLESRSDLIGSRLFAADYKETLNVTREAYNAGIGYPLLLDSIKQVIDESEWWLDVDQILKEVSE